MMCGCVLIEEKNPGPLDGSTHSELYGRDSRTGLQSGQAPHGGALLGPPPVKEEGKGPPQGEGTLRGDLCV